MNNLGSGRPDSIEAGALADEIEITPEMVAAGAEIVWKTDLTVMREAEVESMVNQIFAKMLEMSRVSRRAT